MPTLICYDISNNSLRARLGKRILEYGLERVNRSVYIGDIKETDLRQLSQVLHRLMQKAQPDDSLLILPLQAQQIWSMEILGRNDLDKPSLAGDRHTLIF